MYNDLSRPPDLAQFGQRYQLGTYTEHLDEHWTPFMTENKEFPEEGR